jgi:PAS domain S-box-containing protein
MGSAKRFSTFLVRFLMLFEGVSLLLVVGLLYGVLSRSMTQEFESRLQAEQAEVSMVLQDRFNRLETQLRELSLDNAVRVSLMLGVRGQLEEILSTRFSQGEGARYLVWDATTYAFVPRLADFSEPLRVHLERSHTGRETRMIRFAHFEPGALSVTTVPILRKDEVLGYAHLVYDMSRDQRLWERLSPGDRRQLLFWGDSGPVDLRDGRGLPAGSLQSAQAPEEGKEQTVRTRDGDFLVQVAEFPGLYMAASSAPLREQKQELILLLLGLCLIVFLATILVGMAIGRKVNEPLEDLANQALEVSREPASVFLKREKGRYLEFQKLADAFNQVLLFLLEAQEKLRQKARRDLHASEERYRKTFDIAPYSISISEKESGRFLQVNEAFCRLSGYAREESVGRTVHELGLIPDPSEREVFIRILEERGEVNNHEIQYQCKDGRIMDTLLSARPLEYEGRACVLAVVTDITERKRAEAEKMRLEQQLRHSQKMEAVGTLAGGIAHDFNNLLQAVHGYADLLLLKKGGDAPGREELNEISQAARRASELTHQLLTFSRKVESRLRPLDLNHEVEQVHKLLQRTIPKMIRFELDLQADLHTVFADPAQVEQAMMNLGLNARDAMPDGGTLRVSTRNVTLRAGDRGCPAELEPGDYVRVTLSDTGCGMDPDTREHIFEPFYTTKEMGKGTGLGLSMVYGIVKNHRGAIYCHSTPGRGTTFEIDLPAVRRRATERGEEAPPAKLVGGSETILVVDDEKPIRDLAARVLNHVGYRVIEAPDGEAAVRLFQEKGGLIDLILLDLIMPGMGGERCMEELLRLDENARILISSGYSRQGSPPAADWSPARGFIPKPYDAASMLREVRKALDGI